MAGYGSDKDMTGKSKAENEKNVDIIKGGKGHMFGQQHAGPEKPGTSAHDTSGDGGKFAKGGSGHMFGFRPSTPAKPGMSTPE